MLNEPEHHELPPQSPLTGFINLELNDASPLGVDIIRRFASQHGEIFIGLPASTSG